MHLHFTHTMRQQRRKRYFIGGFLRSITPPVRHGFRTFGCPSGPHRLIRPLGHSNIINRVMELERRGSIVHNNWTHLIWVDIKSYKMFCSWISWSVYQYGVHVHWYLLHVCASFINYWTPDFSEIWKIVLLLKCKHLWKAWYTCIVWVDTKHNVQSQYTPYSFTIKFFFLVFFFCFVLFCFFLCSVVRPNLLPVRISEPRSVSHYYC